MGLVDSYVDAINPAKWFETDTTDPSIQQAQTLDPDQKATLQQLNYGGQRFLEGPLAQQGNLSQMLQGMFPGLMDQSTQAFGQGLSGGINPLTAQGIQEGSQPFMDSLMNQFQNQTVPQIAGQFGALDSARSSGLGTALGRAGSQIPFQAQQMFAQMLGLNNQQQLQQQGQQVQGGLAGMGFGSQLADSQNQFNQLQRQEGFNKASLGLGSPAFANIGFAGTQTPSMFSQLAPAIGPAIAAGI